MTEYQKLTTSGQEGKYCKHPKRLSLSVLDLLSKQ